MGLRQEQPKRIAHERRLLLEHSRLTLGFNIQSWGTTADGELCLNFRLDLPAGEFEGALVYPDLFPDVPAFAGWAVPVDSTDAFEAVKDIKAMQAALGSAWPWEEDLDDRFCALLVHDGRGDIRFFVLSGGTKPLFREYRVLEVCGDGEQRLPESFRGLADATVTVVGLGSLGSKIAVSLARSGVHRFILIDDDVVLPENLVRNELNWLDVGFAKIDAVERELRRIAPGIDVKTSSVRVGGQENPQLAANLSEFISKSSLVIDATAEPQAFVALSALVARCNVAMVWGELFGGGGGALMARSRPGIDAAPLRVRNHIHGVMEAMPPVPEGRFRDYGIEGDGRVYIASDADVTALAASMSQFALDTLCADGDSAGPSRAERDHAREQAREIRQLRTELQRKDKALAEAAALLLLQKKVQALLDGDAAASSISRSVGK